MSLADKKGVDLSSLNGDVSIEKIKQAGFDFAMLRCGYGSDYEVQDDTQFENNVRKCEAAGVPWGAYLYSYALSTEDAKSEVRHVLRMLKGKRPTLPVAIDMEDADGYKQKHGGLNFSNINNVCKIFVEEISLIAAETFPFLKFAIALSMSLMVSCEIPSGTVSSRGSKMMHPFWYSLTL